MIPGLKTSPAFFGGGSSGGGGGGGVSSLTFVNFSASSGSTIAIPSEAIAGDLAVLLDSAAVNGGDSISTVTPSGWTSVANTYGSGSKSLRMSVSRKVLVAGDPGATITGLNSNYERKIMLVFRPNSSIVSVVASTWNAQVTTGNPSSQAVSAAAQPAPLILFAFGAVASAGAAIPSFSTESPSLDNLTRGGTSMGVRVGYKIYNSSPADLSIDIDDGGEINGLQSGYLRFT